MRLVVVANVMGEEAVLVVLRLLTCCRGGFEVVEVVVVVFGWRDMLCNC